MKRLKALCLSVVLSSIISYSFLSFYTKGSADLTVKNNSIRYNVSYEKYNSHDVLVNNINKNTILLLGSSELTVGNDFEEHPRQFLDFSDILSVNMFIVSFVIDFSPPIATNSLISFCWINCLIL